MRIVARPRPSKSSATSVWVKIRWPLRSANSVNPTFCPSTEMLKRSDSAVTVVGAPVLSVVMTPLYAGIGPRTQRRVGQGRGGQARDRSLVSLHGTEATVVVFPHLPIGCDVLVAAPNEIPPHHQLLGKWRTAEQQHTRRALAAVDHLQTAATGRLECQVRDRERRTRDLDAALVEQHAVLEAGIDVEGEVGARVDVDLRAEQRSEGVHGGAVAGELAEEDPHRGTADGARRWHVVAEVATGVTVGVGLRHPQLHTVQDGGGRSGDLGMADARARGHEIQLAGPHHRVYTSAVAMLHLAAEQPTDGLQSGVGMWRHVHPRAAAHVMGAVVVGETPRPDQD